MQSSAFSPMKINENEKTGQGRVILTHRGFRTTGQYKFVLFRKSAY